MLTDQEKEKLIAEESKEGLVDMLEKSLLLWRMLPNCPLSEDEIVALAGVVRDAGA